MTTRSGVRTFKLLSGAAAIFLAMLSCSQGYVSPVELTATAVALGTPLSTPVPTETSAQPTLTPSEAAPADATSTPEPSQPPRPTHTIDPNATARPPIQYLTQAGDTLPSIAGRYNVTADQIRSSEPIPASGLISPGIWLFIPDVLDNLLESIQVLPDSEVVFSPSAADFDVIAYADKAGGYLSRYQQSVSGKLLTGSQILNRIAVENSINPYLLLALLEYKSHWVTGEPTNIQETDYPMGVAKLEYKGLYKQLYWVVQQLSIGYYGWRAGTLTTLPFKDGTVMRISPGLNAGTAAIQYLVAQMYNQDEWPGVLYGGDSLPVLMTGMFGDFWARSRAVEPLYPVDLTQPELQLPFMPRRVWSFTGGPHSAWGLDGALAAVDFGPPMDMDAPDCEISDEWVTAMAPGLIVRSADAIVMLDLDGDGVEQTGWVVMYMHIETRDRIPVGTPVQAGDKIGHPSCEGGVSSGTHVHVVRKYNGEWILADGPLPFVMSGYVAHNGSKIYEGTLVNGDHIVIADPMSSAKAFIQLPSN